jgi:hypothetical protein
MRNSTMFQSTYVEIFGVNFSMLGEVEVLLRNEYTLAKEVLVNLLAISFWDKPKVDS